jgi:protein-S-isoprenylcysteine O-methyltransferase Ste14
MNPNRAETPGVVAPPPLLYAVPLAAGLVAQHYRPQPVLPLLLGRVVGIGLVFLGFIAFVAIAAFRRAGTSPNLWKPATALVVSGPYRWTRNPMYVGLTLWYLGITAWVNSLWPLLALPLALLLMEYGVIRREETYLERQFGEEYRRYKATVRRWP